jgi:TetR/AcrR family transcriptional regulator, regulator of mycofactocin system
VIRNDRPREVAEAVATEGRLGRPPATSRAELERVGIGLFATRGFEATSVDDVAEAAGVSRRTFFRYYSAKADLVWGEFDVAVALMRSHLASMPPDRPLMDSLRLAVVRFNQVPAEQVPHHRQRMRLILEAPEVIARSPLRYATWRQAVDEFAARRLGLDVDDLLPRTIGYCVLGAAVAAYEQWLRDDDESLEHLLQQGFRALEVGLGALEVPDARERKAQT